MSKGREVKDGAMSGEGRSKKDDGEVEVEGVALVAMVTVDMVAIVLVVVTTVFAVVVFKVKVAWGGGDDGEDFAESLSPLCLPNKPPNPPPSFTFFFCFFCKSSSSSFFFLSSFCSCFCCSFVSSFCFCFFVSETSLELIALVLGFVVVDETT